MNRKHTYISEIERINSDPDAQAQLQRDLAILRDNPDLLYFVRKPVPSDYGQPPAHERIVVRRVGDLVERSRQDAASTDCLFDSAALMELARWRHRLRLEVQR